MEYGSIEREIHVDASPEVVFDVISSPEHIREWWGGVEAHVEPRPVPPVSWCGATGPPARRRSSRSPWWTPYLPGSSRSAGSTPRGGRGCRPTRCW